MDKPCGCKHSNPFTCAEKRTLDRIPCSCSCHLAPTPQASKQCVVDIAWRIVNSAMDTAASANGVIVHRQLIGELREALRTDFIRAAESPAETKAEPPNAVLRAALERIAKWFDEFPATGRTWDDGSPMSYAACFGSNGERDFMRQIARVALEQTQFETPVAQASKEQQFREALARIAAGFYTEQGAERHAKDIIRIIDAEEKTIPRFRGKPCTCDNCLGSSVPCRVDAGERLGELWYCRKAAESSLKSTREPALTISKPAQLVTECPKCRTQLAFEGDECGLCNPDFAEVGP